MSKSYFFLLNVHGKGSGYENRDLPNVGQNDNGEEPASQGNRYYISSESRSSAFDQQYGVDLGCDDPGNAWVVFNNTLIDISINNCGETGDNFGAQCFDIYLRNNAFINTSVSVIDANPDRSHSETGWREKDYELGMPECECPWNCY